MTAFRARSSRGFKRRDVDPPRFSGHRRLLAVGALLLTGIVTAALGNPDKQEFVKLSKPVPLKFDELVQLEQTDPPEGQLAARLDKLLHTPFVSNEAYLSGAKPNSPSSPSLGPIIRAICWNIERGIQFDAIRTALAEPEKFDQVLGEKKDPNAKPLTSEQLATVKTQLDLLKPADLLILKITASPGRITATLPADLPRHLK